jgi:hypothetical protein
MRDDECLVTIATFDTVWEASMARGVLEAVGIRALVPEETLVRLSRITILPTGSLQVLEADKDRALTELRRSQIRLVPPPTEGE